MATLASSIPVWAHLLSTSDSVAEHGQLVRGTTTPDAFTDYGNPPPSLLSQHWEAQVMDYPSHYMIPQQSAHMTSNNHLSTLQWANGPDAAHHPSLLQHCTEFQQQHLEVAHHQDQHPHLLQPQQKQLQQQQTKSHMKHLADAHEDSRDSKRPATSMSAQEEVINSEVLVKRPRLEQQQQAPSAPFKMQVRKEKLGERITALQQLVSPFGKTDTASVLLEAIGYIKFLQEQVQVLSTPYMKSNVGPSSMHHDDLSKMGWSKSKNDDGRQDLRSRGLCLVPVSCTLQVANDNGADFWTPAIGGSCR